MHPSPFPFPLVTASTGAVVAVVTAVAIALLVTVLVRRSRRVPRATPEPPHLGASVLVPVSRPRSAIHLVDLAEIIAMPDRGRLIALNVVTEDASDEERIAADLILQQAEVACADAGCETDQVLRVARSVAEGVLHAVVERDATLVLCGWPSVRRPDSRLGPPVDRIVAESPAPVVIARLDGHDWQRVALAERPGEATASQRLAAEVARRIVDDRGLELERREDPLVDPTALVVRGVAPEAGALQRAVHAAGEAGDVLLALSHGPAAEDRRPLLPASAELERSDVAEGR
jgi:hypothetical protein